ncbi:hypothetical protein [uncultured Intestinimonas sp.]|uniref:hypothetical protein n=1 Tax=uncultured Intestinimonas sp. TaxID=1689265 RepID=UPI0025D5A19E|nr:hypothetical protein [uncultured Intestinimonas sp.]
MSILNSFDPDRGALLTPAHAAPPLPGFPETVVLTFRPGLSQRVSGRPGARVLCHIPVFFRIPVYAFP